MKGCRKEFYWKDENGVYLWTNCGNKHKNDFSNRTESMLCPECSESKSYLDKSESRKTPLDKKRDGLNTLSASGLTPKKETIKDYLEHNAVIHQANGFVKMKYERFKELQNRVLEEQKKEELEFLKETIRDTSDCEGCAVEIREDIKERIKQLEATKIKCIKVYCGECGDFIFNAYVRPTQIFICEKCYGAKISKQRGK